MDFLHLSLEQWLLAFAAAFLIGIAKAGFGGVGMLSVALMAALMRGHELESTGVVLPMLIFGDLMAVWAFRSHARWPVVLGLIPPALTGVVAGFFCMGYLSNTGFKPLIGWTVLLLAGLQLFRQWRPRLFQSVPHSRGFTWAAGISAGFTTMVANAAGPIMALYLLAVELPKLALVGTGAWYFLILNLIKVPFSASLGFITPGSLLFNVMLIPAIAGGIFTGQFLLQKIDQRPFEQLLLLLTALTALHLVFF